MPHLPAGPFRVLTSVEGASVPYYIIPFDADGHCEAPQTRTHLLDAVADSTDVFLFSHGWNNDWTVATRRYEDFIKGWQSLRKSHGIVAPAGYKPLLLGIFWPSQALAWFEQETGPGFAASDPVERAAGAQREADTLREIAQAVPESTRERFYELAQASSLTQGEAREFAGLLAATARADDEGARDDALTGDDLLMAARSLAAPEPDFNDVGTVGGGVGGGPATAGLIDFLAKFDPRQIVKPFTVWQMKDRAGRVGQKGVAPLLTDLLKRSKARVHLLGHSYGCKVVMTALCTPATLPRSVESALLLQPAVSQYAFAAKVPARDRAGGYFQALERVRQPIVATYSANDVPLTKLFHVAVRRHDDLGELQFAAGGSPSKYAAMGGFGPQASDAAFVDIQDAGSTYSLGGKRLIAVNGTRTISGHGAVSTESTWWLSLSLASALTTSG